VTTTGLTREWCGLPTVVVVIAHLGDERAGPDTVRVADTVLIVDDHAGFRGAARLLLEVEGYDVVGEAEDGMTGIDAARRLRPDIVLLDVQLPDIDGFEVAERLCAAGDGPAIVLISSRDRADYGRCLAATPARGFLPKAELSASGIADLVVS
jgi:DNA-binding NarL/FixJ family response regulator